MEPFQGVQGYGTGWPPLHTGDFIGLSCIYNLMSMGLDKEAKSLFQTMDESIRNREELSRLNL